MEITSIDNSFKGFSLKRSREVRRWVKVFVTEISRGRESSHAVGKDLA